METHAVGAGSHVRGQGVPQSLKCMFGPHVLFSVGSKQEHELMHPAASAVKTVVTLPHSGHTTGSQHRPGISEIMGAPSS